MSKVDRRNFVICGVLGSPSLVFGWRGGDPQAAPTGKAVPAPLNAAGPALVPTTATAPAPETIAPMPDWDIGQTLAFVAGSGWTVDLNDTLPAGVTRGGRFSVHESGSPLPCSATLGADGLLSMPTSVAAGATAGVVFSYLEP